MKERVYNSEFKIMRLCYQREKIKELADNLDVQVEYIYK